MLSLASEIQEKKFETVDDVYSYVTEKLNFLVTARPTAVNMADARDRFVQIINNMKNQLDINLEEAKAKY